MTPEEIYQRMTKVLEPFGGNRINLTTEVRIRNAIRDILVKATPCEDITRWIKIELSITIKTNVIGVRFFSHPNPPSTVAKFIWSLRDHGFLIRSDLGRFDDTN